MIERSKNFISIPEYFKRFIDSRVDLTVENKICCPFHKEDTPSFSYSPERGTWRCFGACKCGGDVIELHRVNNKLKDRATAEASLRELLGIKREVTFKRERPTVDKETVERRLSYTRAIACAKTVDDWLELDQIMSYSPPNQDALDNYWKGRISNAL